MEGRKGLMKRKYKVFTAFIILSLLAGGTAGCSKNKEEKKMVHYKEEQLTLPEGVGIIYDMMETKEGSLSILTDTESETGRIFELDRKTNEWKQVNESFEGLSDSAVFDAKFIDENESYVSVLYHALSAGSEEEAQALAPKYFMIGKDGTGKEIQLDLSSGDKYAEDNLFSVAVKRDGEMIGIDNAQIIYSFTDKGELNYENKEVRDLDAEVVDMIAVKNIVYTVLDSGKVYCMDADSGAAADGDEGVIKYLQYDEGEYEAYADPDADVIYKLSGGKLYSYDIGSGKQKEELDLKYFDLKNGIRYQILSVKAGELYISYTLSTGQVKLNKYVYDKKGFEIKKQALKIYSLTESYELEVLADAFNVKYPDSPVEIVYGYTSEDGKTQADAVKLLNTELLAGNGPDILVMDGLTAGTYYEEGLLKDITDILDMDKIKKNIFENMLAPYSDGNVQYALPLGFQIYGIVGSKNMVDVFDDTNAFLNVAEKENTGFAICDLNLSESANIVYIQNISRCFSEEGDLDREKLSELYTNLNRLYKLSGNSLGEEQGSKLFEFPELSAMDTEVQWIYYDQLPFIMAPYFNQDSFFASKYLVKQEGYEQGYVHNNDSIVYKDKLIMGVSKQSAKDEEAKEFLEFALNDGQETFSQSLLALPVQKKALKKALVNNEKQEPYKISEFGFGDDPKMIAINGIGLNDKDYDELEKELNKAVHFEYGDARLRDTIMGEASNYCLEKKTLAEAVGDAAEKVALYNKE